jgi:flagellin-like protein
VNIYKLVKPNMIMDKRGLSPVIATVLLIMLVFILAAIIFLWMRGFVSEQIVKFDKPAEETCQQVEFDAELMYPTLQVVNRGNIPISGFEMKVYQDDGNSEIKKLPIGLGEGQSLRSDFSQYGESAALRIVLSPIILGNVKDKTINKQYTCLDRAKTILNRE